MHEVVVPCHPLGVPATVTHCRCLPCKTTMGISLVSIIVTGGNKSGKALEVAVSMLSLASTAITDEKEKATG